MPLRPDASPFKLHQATVDNPEKSVDIHWHRGWFQVSHHSYSTIISKQGDTANAYRF